MLDHVGATVSDLARSRAFYDAALAPLGYTLLSEDAGSLGYGAGQVALWVLRSEAPVKDDDGSGLHICFVAPTRRSVDGFHAAALKHGGRDNGAPGPRPDYGPSYYAAFVKDPDGYRLEAQCGA